MDDSIEIRAVERMLRPIARLLVPFINFRALSETLEAIYADEARRFLKRQGKPVNFSRVAALTGITTRKLRQMKEGPEPWLPKRLETRVLDGWSSKEGYVDANRNPIHLPVHGPEPSLQHLVSRLGGRNVTVTPILESLLEAGVIRYVDRDHVQMLSHEFVPTTVNKRGTLEVASDAITRMVTTITRNLETPSDHKHQRLRQRQIWSQRIPLEKHGQARQALQEIANAHIRNCEKLLARFEDQRLPDDPGGLGIGCYVFDEYERDEHAQK